MKTTNMGFEVMTRHFGLGSIGVFALLSANANAEPIFSDGFDITPPKIILSTNNLTVREGGVGQVNVSLEAMPEATTTVEVVRASGDTDLSVSQNSSLQFSVTDWNIPQAVVFAAAEDSDEDDGTAQFRISATGYVDSILTVTENDNDGAGAFEAALNDTGIESCFNESSQRLSCPVTGFPDQDAEFGRDVTDNNFSDGKAGFSFIKISDSGAELPASSTTFDCVLDTVTGLMWETKTDDNGQRDRDNTYTWLDTNAATNGSDSGTAGGGTCVGSTCDTESYVAAINALNLCGFNNWRMPTVNELYSVIDFGAADPAIDVSTGSYFQHTLGAAHWTSVSNAINDSGPQAWHVLFDSGSVGISDKSAAYSVRLVRDHNQ